MGLCLLQCAAAFCRARGRGIGAVCRREALALYRRIGAVEAAGDAVPHDVDPATDEAYVLAPPHTCGGRPAASAVVSNYPPSMPFLNDPDRPPQSVFLSAVEADVLVIDRPQLPQLLGGAAGHHPDVIPWPSPLPAGVYMFESGASPAIQGFVEIAGTAVARVGLSKSYVLLTRRAWILPLGSAGGATQPAAGAGWWNSPLSDRARLLIALGCAPTQNAARDAQSAADLLGRPVHGVEPFEYSVHFRTARLITQPVGSIAEVKAAYKADMKEGLVLDCHDNAFRGVEASESLHSKGESECFCSFSAPAGKDLGFFPLTRVASTKRQGSMHRFMHKIDGTLFASIHDRCVFDRCELGLNAGTSRLPATTGATGPAFDARSRSVDEATAGTDEEPNVRFMKDSIPGRYVYGFGDDEDVPILRVVAVSDLVAIRGRCRLLTYYGEDYESIRKQVGYKAKPFTDEQRRVTCSHITEEWLRRAWVPYKLGSSIALHHHRS